MQTARFWIWERWSCDWTTVLVGRCVMRTAEYVVLTHWPPGQILVLDLDVDLVGLGQDGHGGR